MRYFFKDSKITHEEVKKMNRKIKAKGHGGWGGW
jgi:hypothetical protein